MPGKSAAKNSLFTTLTKLPIDAHSTDSRDKIYSPAEHTAAAEEKSLSSSTNLEPWTPGLLFANSAALKIVLDLSVTAVAVE